MFNSCLQYYAIKHSSLSRASQDSSVNYLELFDRLLENLPEHSQFVDIHDQTLELEPLTQYGATQAANQGYHLELIGDGPGRAAVKFITEIRITFERTKKIDDYLQKEFLSDKSIVSCQFVSIKTRSR